jgi:hypothetical protein
MVSKYVQLLCTCKKKTVSYIQNHGNVIFVRLPSESFRKMKERKFLARQELFEFIIMIVNLSFNNSHPPLLSVSDVVANHMNSTYRQNRT